MSLDELRQLTLIDPMIAVDRSGLQFALSINDSLEIRRVNGKGVSLLGNGFLPTWCPTGDILAFYSSRTGDVQLWTWRPGQGPAKQLTRFKGGIDPEPTGRIIGYLHDAFHFSWSPDCKEIAFTSREHSDQNPRDEDQAKPAIFTTQSPTSGVLDDVFTGTVSASADELWMADSHTVQVRKRASPIAAFNHLFVVTINDGKVQRLLADDSSYFSPEWNAARGDITLVRTETPAVPLGTRASSIISVNPSSGTKQNLAVGPGFKWAPKWSPAGDILAFAAGPTALTARHLHFATVQRDGSFEIQEVSAPPSWGTFFWTGKGENLVLLCAGPAGRQLIRLDREQRRRQPDRISDVSHSRRLASSLEVVDANATGDLIWMERSRRSTAAIYFRSPDSRTTRKLEDLVPKTVRGKLGRTMEVNWRNSRGSELSGSVLLPPRYEPGNRYPMIVDVYPLMTGDDWTSPLGGNYAWASMGYVVFRPAEPSPNVWSYPARGAVNPREALGPDGWDIAIDDVVSGVNALVKQQVADPDRICIFGHSNGAAVVNELVTRVTSFKCAVSINPAVSDWVRFGLLDPANDALALTNGISIEDNLPEYIALSPVFHLRKTKIPILLVAGSRDSSATLDQIEMFNALRRLGRVATLLRYRRSGHIIEGRELDDLWMREMEFFARYLKR